MTLWQILLLLALSLVFGLIIFAGMYCSMSHAMDGAKELGETLKRKG